MGDINGRRKVVHLLGGSLLLVGLIFLLFYPVIHYDFVTFDDPDYVVANPYVTQGVTRQSLQWLPRGIVSSQWHPVTMLSHMLDCEFFGLSAGKHHMVNVAWHAANTGLLFLLMAAITGQLIPCFFMALIWGIHPLAVDSVAWIAQRKNLISLFFGLSALWTYARYANTQRRYFMGCSLVLFFIGLMAKSTLIIFPILLLLVDYWPLNRNAAANSAWRTLPALLHEKIPYFLLSAFFALAIFRSQSSGGALAGGAAFPLGWRISFTLDNYVHYLWKFIRPVDLVVIYPWPRVGLSWPQLVLDATVLIGISVLVYAFRRHRFLVVGWCWFIVALLPVCGLTPAGAAIKADRFTYLPLIGLSMMLVWTGWEWGLRRRGIWAFVELAACMALLTLGLTTRRQLPVWTDGGTLYAHALSVNPENPTALNNMAMWLRNNDDVEKAVQLLSKAVDLEPRHYLAQSNLGELLMLRGELATARIHAEKALKTAPWFAPAHLLLARLDCRNENWQSALTNLQRSVALDADNPLAWDLLADISEIAGPPESADEFRQRALWARIRRGEAPLPKEVP